MGLVKFSNLDSSNLKFANRAVRERYADKVYPSARYFAPEERRVQEQLPTTEQLRGASFNGLDQSQCLGGHSDERASLVPADRPNCIHPYRHFLLVRGRR